MSRLAAGIHDRYSHGTGVPELTFVGSIGAQAAILAVTALLSSTIVLPTYGPNVPINAALGDYFRIVVTNAVAFQIDSPTNLRIGQPIVIEVRNTSGGAHGAITVGANIILQAAIPAIATGFNRKYVFHALTALQISEITRTAADVAN